MDKKKRILVVDDEPDLCDIIQLNLECAGYAVETAQSAENALQLDLSKFNLILLDVMMDGMSGFDFMKILTSNPATHDIPVLFLTAKDTEEDILKGFNLGADDYIPKPFHVREVIARVKAVLSRTERRNNDSNDYVEYKGVIMDINGKSISIDGQIVPLTRMEFEILRLMIMNPGTVFTRQSLIEQVWPSDVIVTDRTVDVNITRIRKKLGSNVSLLRTRQGYGYLFE